MDSLLLPDAQFKKDREGCWSIDIKEKNTNSPYLDEAVFTVVDVETTGGRPPLHRIIEIAAVKVAGGKIDGNYSSLINPGRYIPHFVAGMTGINEDMISSMPPADEVMPSFLDFLGNSVFVAHNAPFDLMFVNHELQNMELEALPNRVLCTQLLAKRLMPELEKLSLDSLAAALAIPIEGRHRALGDATATARILIAFLNKAAEMGIERVEELLQLQKIGLKGGLLRLQDEWHLFADLPERPGVYMMKGKSGELLYLGNAKNIKDGVRGHYYSKKRVSNRKVKMLEKVKKIDYTPTDSELGAVLLEPKLLNKLRPRHNRDGSYYRLHPFLKVTANRPCPRIYAVKDVMDDGALYFGPYKNMSYARAVADTLNDMFRLRRCSTSIPRENQQEQCSYYETDDCVAPCSGRVSAGKYDKAVQQALETLMGGGNGLLREVEKRYKEKQKEPQPKKAEDTELGFEKPHRFFAPGGIGSTPLHLLDIIIALPCIYQGEVELFLIRAGELRKRLISAVSDLNGNSVLSVINSCYFRKQKRPPQRKKAYRELRLIADWLGENESPTVIIQAAEAASPQEIVEKLQEEAARLWNS